MLSYWYVYHDICCHIDTCSMTCCRIDTCTMMYVVILVLVPWHMLSYWYVYHDVCCHIGTCTMTYAVILIRVPWYICCHIDMCTMTYVLLHWYMYHDTKLHFLIVMGILVRSVLYHNLHHLDHLNLSLASFCGLFTAELFTSDGSAASCISLYFEGYGESI
jgi:hypothetical protein